MNKLWKHLPWLMTVALFIIAAGCGPKPWEQYGMSQEDYERLKEWITPIVEPPPDNKPPGSSAPGGSHMSANDPTPIIIVITSAPPASGAGLGERPVRFRNLGRLPYTVMPASYTLPDGTPGLPANASTVAFPGSHGALSLPLGTYTWCFYWELGDTNGDGMADYAHAIYPYPLELNANSSDSVDLAISVDLFAPAGSGERAGACAPAGLPAALATKVQILPSATPGRQWPSAPITYQADLGGAPLVLTIDFQSDAVTGTINWSGDENYGRFAVTGIFDKKSMQVDTIYAGSGGIVAGVEVTDAGTIQGIVSDDFGNVSGVLVNGDGESFEFTAYR